MKRVGHLWEKMVSTENLTRAIETVNDSHRWIRYPDIPNKTVLWVSATLPDRVRELREMIERGFVPSPVIKKTRYDANAGKWREICEPKLWPDQYIHHILIQVLEPVMMRGMDRWCCGSIKARGAHYGIRAIKKWMKSDAKGTKWCAELDIRHFYDSLEPERVMKRMKRLVKDHRVLDLLWRVIQDGIQIGAYFSQWLANTFLQPLDQIIRESGASRYVRYMDNFTIFARTKKKITEIIEIARAWLYDHGLELKANWQKFMVRARMPRSEKRHRRRYPNALGYRFGRGFALLRKHSLLRLRRQLRRFYRLWESGKPVQVRFAQGLLSRLGLLRHCNAQAIYRKDVKKKTQKHIKNVVRIHAKEAQTRWNMYLEQSLTAA